MKFTNLSGYDTRDLRDFFEEALDRFRVPTRQLELIATAAPKRSRGCAEVGKIECSRTRCRLVPGNRMVIAIGPPSYYHYEFPRFMRRLQHLTRHEGAHIIGYEHEDMDHRLLHSLGPVSPWALRHEIRYRGRAPNQLAALG
jgi:hypothetical protein